MLFFFTTNLNRQASERTNERVFVLRDGHFSYVRTRTRTRTRTRPQANQKRKQWFYVVKIKHRFQQAACH